MTDSQTTGSLVLCGGESQRMGRPKLMLPFGNELLLQRVVRILGTVTQPVGVVAAAEQELPDLGATQIIRDADDALGPLAGIAAGLTAFADQVDAVYMSSCDVPFLQPAFVSELIKRLGSHDIVIVKGNKHVHTLAAIYRTSLAPIAQQLVDERRLRPIFLLDECDALIVAEAELRTVDPKLASLRNVNTPDEYNSALVTAGLAEAAE